MACRLLSRCSSFTRTRFSSYLPLLHCNSQAGFSLDYYIKRLQNDFSARQLASRNCHVLATPLLDVLYVSVQSNKFDDCERARRPLEIYGIIQLIDEQNYTYDVYHREKNNAETVLHGGNLSLTRPDGTQSSLFLPCVSALKMRVHLRDAAAEGQEIAMGDFDVQLMDKTCYHDIIKTEIVDGHLGFASVQYASLPYAVIAEVELSLAKNDKNGSDQSHALIYGTISASSKVKDGSISSVLFNRAPSEPIMVDLAAPIKLSREILAVPAYSCIQIKADLWDHHTNQQIASDVIVAYFNAHDVYRHIQTLDLGQNYHINVVVHWMHAYRYVFESSGYAFDGQKLLCGHLRSLASHRLAPNLDLELPESYPSIFSFGEGMVEVFSISISPYNDAITSICGTIKVYDIINHRENMSYIFEKNNSNPEILEGDMKIKSLEWQSNPIPGTWFGMDLRLTDDLGREVCKGRIAWDDYVVEVPMSLYDKRLSSVIRGQYGYAIVHYALFSDTMIAKVEVVFITKRFFDVPFKISGDIVARYSTFIYSTYSEKEFFQSTLFGENHHIIVAGGSQLVLKKSLVPVPYGSSLIVDVKLHAQAIYESSEGISLEHLESLDKVVNFDVGVDETCIRRMEGEDFHVDVFVEWTSG